MEYGQKNKVEFIDPPKEASIILNDLRRLYYEEFNEAKIILLFRTGRWKKAGEISIVTDKQRKAGIKADYIMTISNESWNIFDNKQQRALIDHELYHMQITFDKGSNVQWKLKDHEIEEFCEIAERYGAWSSPLKALKDVLNKEVKIDPVTRFKKKIKL